MLLSLTIIHSIHYLVMYNCNFLNLSHTHTHRVCLVYSDTYRIHCTFFFYLKYALADSFTSQYIEHFVIAANEIIFSIRHEKFHLARSKDYNPTTIPILIYSSKKNVPKFGSIRSKSGLVLARREESGQDRSSSDPEPSVFDHLSPMLRIKGSMESNQS